MAGPEFSLLVPVVLHGWNCAAFAAGALGTCAAVDTLPHCEQVPWLRMSLCDFQWELQNVRRQELRWARALWAPGALFCLAVQSGAHSFSFRKGGFPSGKQDNDAFFPEVSSESS